MDRTRREWLIDAAGATSGSALASLGLVSVLASVTPLARAAAGKPVVLGQSVPFSGAASEIGMAFATGAKLGVAAFNADPGNSRKLELRQVDDGYDAARATVNAKKLLADGADMLFGFVGTASASAGANVAKQEGAVLLAPFAGADTLRDGSYPQVFNVRPSMADEAFKMVRLCGTIGQQRIVFMATDDAMGRAGLVAVNSAIAELKMPPLAGVALVPADGNVEAAVAAAQALKPQAIIQMSLFNTTAASIRQLRKTGYAGSFLNFSVVGIDPLFSALGKDINGVVVSQVVPSPKSTALQIVRDYNAALENSDQPSSYESLEGFIAARVAGEAVRRSGASVSRAGLQRVLTGMTEFDVGGYRVHPRAGVRESGWAIDLVSFRADGRLVR